MLAEKAWSLKQLEKKNGRLKKLIEEAKLQRDMTKNLAKENF